MSLTQNYELRHTAPTQDYAAARSTRVGFEFLMLLGPCMLFGAIPFQWSAGIPVGDFSVSPFHVAALYCFIVFLADLRHVQALMMIVKQTLLTQLSIVGYLFILALSIMWSPNEIVGIAITVKYVLIYMLSLTVAAIIKTRRQQFTISMAYVAIPLSILCFFLNACFVFHLEGQNFPLEVFEGLKTGSLDHLLHHVVNPLLMQTESVEAAEINNIKLVAKNSFAAGLFTLFCVARMAPKIRTKSTIYRMLRIGRFLLLLFFLASILLLGSRMALAAAVFCLVTESIVDSSRGFKGVMRVAFTLALVCTLITVAILSSDDNRLVSGVNEISIGRFEQIGSDSRWNNYKMAVYESQDDIMYGKGVGAYLPDRKRVHNNFLGGAYEAGLFGFLTITAIYVLLWFDALRSLMIRMRIHRRLANAELWSLLVLIMPLAHCLIAGDSGRFTNAEWLCIALFWAFHLDYKADPGPSENELVNRIAKPA
ncbi:hypothetical protein Pla110_02060 [Polystyrenella longa]|uniref:O-Antigen ligase n=1 Tax=Polystyrenella longa TaxID=2528007 RepID=A0A518CH03_9PLAN|nr:hypothetical protein [Polystyrenella longa]QDU78502.1 hypothetical protein Pla110_02060 [Polystyrenella longa]